jgi:hypothetical protein
MFALFRILTFDFIALNWRNYKHELPKTDLPDSDSDRRDVR